jgi:hypothetical protein
MFLWNITGVVRFGSYARMLFVLHNNNSAYNYVSRIKSVYIKTTSHTKDKIMSHEHQQNWNAPGAGLCLYRQDGP